MFELLAAGIVNVLHLKYLAPLILGLILGDQIEINLVRAIMTDDHVWLFLTRPISGAMLGLSMASVLVALWQHRRSQKRVARDIEPNVDF